MAKGDDIEERLIRFAVRILKVCAALPDHQKDGMFVDSLSAVGRRRRRIMAKGAARKVHAISSTS